jgi:hypothetical protein
MAVLSILGFGICLWLGLYIVNRDLRDIRLLLSGAGLVAYGLGLFFNLLQQYAGAANLSRAVDALFVLAPVCWAGVFVINWRAVTAPQVRLRWPLRVIQVGTLLVIALAVLLVLAPEVLPRPWVVGLMGVTLVVMGTALTVLHAREEGEALLPDIARSFDYSCFMALLFGGQVGLAMALGAGVNAATLALLHTSIATAIAIQIFAGPVQAALDEFALARFPRLRAARAELRTAAELLPRINDAFDVDSLDEAELTRLTRRALSHFGDLHRLAGSPLTQLPIVRARLTERGVDDTTVESAAELKALLAESIDHLKPRTGTSFGTSAEWRHYNALYYTYVVGLRPYSRRASENHVDVAYRDVLEWFSRDVPERTLHNWQNAAARLVAQDLRERSHRLTPSQAATAATQAGSRSQPQPPRPRT